MHVHLPKPLHGWREFAGEVGIIVIGVLIALGAEQVASTLHQRRQAAEEAFHATSIGLATVPTIRRLAELQPLRLALMHGSSFEGDAATQLTGLADAYQALAA